METADVVIVGGGPSGSYAGLALKLTFHNLSGFVLEQHNEIGYPADCSVLHSHQHTRQSTSLDSYTPSGCCCMQTNREVKELQSGF